MTNTNLGYSTPLLLYDLRKFNFTNRVILVWNSWPNHVVSADTINNKESCAKTTARCALYIAALKILHSP